jgi:hypothetical protein
MKNKKKGKTKLREKLPTSNLNKDGIEPAVTTKTRYIKTDVPVTFNSNHAEDRKRLNKLFDDNYKKQPKYFIKLANELKNKNKVNSIFEYASMYISGKFTIAAIDMMQREKKVITIYSRPNAKIAKK